MHTVRVQETTRVTVVMYAEAKELCLNLKAVQRYVRNVMEVGRTYQVIWSALPAMERVLC